MLQGWYALFPLANETTNTNIVGWTALVGGTLFEVGAYCMVVEAVNRSNAVRFGYEVQSNCLPSSSLPSSTPVMQDECACRGDGTIVALDRENAFRALYGGTPHRTGFCLNPATIISALNDRYH